MKDHNQTTENRDDENQTIEARPPEEPDGASAPETSRVVERLVGGHIAVRPLPWT